MQNTRPNPTQDPELDWDILEYARADGADLKTMDDGHHYDYVNQTWKAGHDHAHFCSQSAPLLFCGADAATCTGTTTIVGTV